MFDDIIICNECGVLLNSCYIKDYNVKYENYQTRITFTCPVCKSIYDGWE